MAWLVGDGFDFYNVSTDAALNTGVWAVVTQCTLQPFGTSRFGAGNWMTLGNLSASAGNLGTAAFANSTTIYVNMNIISNQAHVGGGTTQCVGFTWRDGAAIQGGLFLRNGGDFVVTSGDKGSAVLATSSVLIPVVNVWHHIQAKIVVNNATGTVDLRLDGSPSANFSSGSINTRNGTANAFANIINITSTSPSLDGVDDFYAFNDQGAAPITWQGDVRAVQQVPTTDSAITWTRNTGPNNCLTVDDLRQDGDTTYVATNVVNNVDTYGLAALATTPSTVVAVVPRYIARMDDAGPHTVTAQLTSGGTTVTLSNYNTTSSYAYQQAVYAQDPNTSAAWSAAAVNALLLSIKDVL